MKDLVKTMARLDPELIEYRNRLTGNITSEEKAALDEKIQNREKYLIPMYHQVAVHFADLHDTPERMQEKGVIQVKYLFN